MEIREQTISLAIPYGDRAGRAGFITGQFGWAIAEPLLDVGCGDKHLKELLPEGFGYTGLDFSESADVHCNLDNESIPFNPGSFATVVCTDVLEHLESIHRVLAELFKLSCQYVIVSLPNCWCDMKYLMAGKGNGSGKYYGLPVHKPPDRHRWFFNYSEARAFLIGNSEGKARKGHFFKYYGLKGRTFYPARALLPTSLFDNLFVNTLWAVFEK